MLEADLPAAGSYIVQVTTGAYAVTGQIIAAATSLANVEQVAASAVAIASAVDTSTPSNNITTVDADSWVHDALSTGQAIVGLSAGAGQTIRTNIAGSSHSMQTSTKVVAAAGSTSMSWTLSGSANRYAHVLTVWSPLP